MPSHGDGFSHPTLRVAASLSGTFPAFATACRRGARGALQARRAGFRSRGCDGCRAGLGRQDGKAILSRVWRGLVTAVSLLLTRCSRSCRSFPRRSGAPEWQPSWSSGQLFQSSPPGQRPPEVRSRSFSASVLHDLEHAGRSILNSLATPRLGGRFRAYSLVSLVLPGHQSGDVTTALFQLKGQQSSLPTPQYVSLRCARVR